MPTENIITNYEILASLGSLVAVIDETGLILSVNKTWNDFAIENGAEHLNQVSTGSNYFDVCRKSILNGEGFAAIALEGIFSVFKKEKQVFEMEYPSDSPFEKRWFLLHAMNLNEDYSRVVVSHQNITKRKYAEEALKASELKYRRLFETAKDGILILDALTGKIIDVNPFLIKKLSFPFAYFIGKELWQIGIFSDAEASKKSFIELQEKKYIRYENMPLKKQDGDIMHVEFVSNVYDMGSGVVIQCNIRDITENYKANLLLLENESKYRLLSKQLQEKNQDLRQFTYILSHNLRSHIAKIQGLVYLINKGGNDKEENHTFLQIITGEVSGIDEVIRDLNQILSIQNTLKEAIDFIDFDTIFNQIKQVLSNEIKESGVLITADFSAYSGVKTIKSYCYSIIYNLLSNAIKYRSTNRQSIIHLKTTSDDAFVCLSVKDNGMGIDLEKNKEKVFSLYKRFHGNKIQGKGMGLNLVKVQAESLGGRVELESKVDQGSEFKIYLPIQ
ncbi:MAG: ATP-binding protein [Sphingobacteriia bacterium]|jgi:PAS domain S-box-containing protein